VYTNWLVPRRDFDDSILEMMDRPQPVSVELEVDLENLRKLNRFFGSYALVRYFLRRWFRIGTSVSVVDLCTGFGDIPRFTVDWCRAHDVEVQITAVDFQPATLELAARRSRSYPEIAFVASDVFEFKPPIRADFLFCSLALHHFADDRARLLLQRARALATRGILIADLERSDLGMIGIDLLTCFLYREPMTRYDARLSFRRAFSFSEMRQIAANAGWERFGHRRFPVSRQAIWLEELNTGEFPPRMANQ
jgi:ubiquinone/menaquinone biosynthesis C-methylase UbiE